MAYEGKIKIDPEIDMSKIRKQIAELTKAMKINAQIDTTVAQRQIAQLADAMKDMSKSLSGGKAAAA